MIFAQAPGSGPNANCGCAAVDVIGLSQNPPAHSAVFYVDEKTAIEVLSISTVATAVMVGVISSIRSLYIFFGTVLIGPATALDAQPFRHALELNMEFSFIIFRQADLPITLRIIESMWLLSGPTMNLFYPELAIDRLGIKLHRLQLEAIRSGDLERCLHYMRKEAMLHSTRNPAAFHSGNPALSLRAGRPFACNAATASVDNTQYGPRQ